jgi:hypothetical protein
MLAATKAGLFCGKQFAFFHLVKQCNYRRRHARMGPAAAAIAIATRNRFSLTLAVHRKERPATGAGDRLSLNGRLFA